MKEYVAAPAELLARTAELAPYLAKSYNYAKSLKPKPTTRPQITHQEGPPLVRAQIRPSSVAIERVLRMGRRSKVAGVGRPDAQVNVIERGEGSGRGNVCSC